MQLSFTMLTLGVISRAGTDPRRGRAVWNVVLHRCRAHPEIGVRMALGATARQVRRMVVVQGARVVAAGVVIGILAALASTRALGESALWGDGRGRMDLPRHVGRDGVDRTVGELPAGPAGEQCGSD